MFFHVRNLSSLYARTWSFITKFLLFLLYQNNFCQIKYFFHFFFLLFLTDRIEINLKKRKINQVNYFPIHQKFYEETQRIYIFFLFLDNKNVILMKGIEHTTYTYQQHTCWNKLSHEQRGTNSAKKENFPNYEIKTTTIVPFYAFSSLIVEHGNNKLKN